MLVFRCADDVLLPAVNAYIQMNNLYGTGKNCRYLPLDKLEETDRGDNGFGSTGR